MYTIEQSLDAILIKLKENWNNSGGRKHLECETLLKEFGYPPDWRKHEFFERLIDRLKQDGYAEFTDNVQLGSKISFYQEETLITVEGYYFITHPDGGYEKKAIYDAKVESLKGSYERKLLYGTWGVAIGAVALVIWEIIKTFCIEH